MHQENIELINSHSSLAISMENVFHTLVSIVRISYPEAKEELQINTVNFEESKQEIEIILKL